MSRVAVGHRARSARAAFPNGRCAPGKSADSELARAMLRSTHIMPGRLRSRAAAISMLWLALGHGVRAQTAQPVAPLAPQLALVAPSRVMSLPDALAFARAHQPALRAALAQIAAARADARVPSAQWQPTVVAGAELLGATANNTTASYVGISGIDVPRIGGTRVTDTGDFTPFASTLAAVGLQQELFDFGRIAAQTAARDALVEVDRLGADATWIAVALNVEESYFAVRAAHAIALASEQAVARARVHRDFAQAQVGAGLWPPINLTRADADLVRFEVGSIRARGALAAAQAAFAAAVGSTEPALDVIEEPPASAELPSLSEALARAAQRDPVLQQAVAGLRAQRALTRAISASTRPNLQITATLSGREGGATPSSGPGPRYDGWLPRVPNWDLGVVLRWPLYDAVNSAQVDASLARESVRAADIDTARLRQIAQVEQAYTAVSVAGAALPALERALQAAQQNYEQADARFKGGLGTVVELSDAEAVRVEADIGLTLGRFDLARARAVLGRAIAEHL
jgi:outer membrane protein TolC